MSRSETRLYENETARLCQPQSGVLLREASMRRAGLWIATMIVISTTSIIMAGEGSSSIELGGPRQVTAAIATTDDNYEVSVRMLPVKTFDPTTNALLSREKSRAYALQALARHLGGRKTGDMRLSISGATTVKAKADGTNFLFVLRVPQNRVALEGIDELKTKGTRSTTTPTTSNPADAIETSRDASPLLTCKQDYQTTAESLLSNLRGELKAAVEKFGDDEPAFDAAVAGLEETLDVHWEKLRPEIEKDKLLLSHERQELLTEVQAHHEQFLDSLRQAVDLRDKQQAQKKMAKP